MKCQSWVRQKSQEKRHQRIIILAWIVVLRMESSSMPKTRLMYQQPFSLAGILFYHLSPFSTLSSTGLVKDKMADKSSSGRPSGSDTIGILLFSTQCKPLLTNTGLCIFMLCLSQKQRDTWDMGEWVTPVDTTSGLKGSKSRSSKDSSFLVSGISFC